MKNFIYEWKFALFNIVIYTMFATSLFYLTGWQMLWLFGWGWLCSALGNSVLLHRYYTHKQFKLSKVTEYLLLPFAIIIGIGSPIQYALLHRQHHRVCDQIGDPHSPHKLGILTVIFGIWEFFPTRYFTGLKAPIPKDLVIVPLHRFIHNNYYLLWFVGLGICTIASLPVAVAMFSWAAVYQKVWENVVVNGICHPSQDNIKDWPWLGFVTGGESMQKFHHNQQTEIKFSNNPLVDPVYWIIQLVKSKG